MPPEDPDQASPPLLVSALIATRKNGAGQTEILNVRAHNKSHYGFPGGKIEAGEMPEQAIVRETLEEIGAKPFDLEFINLYTSLTLEARQINMYVFRGSIPTDISPQAEIAELHWLTYEQMSERIDLLTPMTVEHILPLIKYISE